MERVIHMYAYDITPQHHVCRNAPLLLILLYSNSNARRFDVKAEAQTLV
jgi:hypothetical protein